MLRTAPDDRIYGERRWSILPEGVERLMQVPDDMRKCVVFLWYTHEGSRKPAGTAFFVGWPVPGQPGAVGQLLLTAHHVIAGISQYSDDGLVHIRINTNDGGATWAHASVDSWWQPDTELDCAVLAWHPPGELNAEYRAWMLSSAATPEVIDREGLGIGDEVFAIGLFVNHTGRERNEPIVRVGNIAAMPVDPIRTALYGDMPAILVEARSIGGLSGSPVFVHLGFSRYREGQIMQRQREDASQPGPFIFLGLMHGHWDAEAAEVDAFPGNEKINMGIGIVVPAAEILSAMRPRLEEVVKEAKKQADEASAPTPDTVTPISEFDRFEQLAPCFAGEMIDNRTGRIVASA